MTYIRLFINPILESLKPGTVRAIHDFFKQIVNAAIDVEIVKRNRFTKIQMKDTENKNPNILTATQLNQFLMTMKQTENETAIMTALLLAHTGMRIGEAQTLQWTDIDFENQTISIKKTRDNYGTRTPKTTNSARKIKLHNYVVHGVAKIPYVLQKAIAISRHKIERRIVSINLP